MLELTDSLAGRTFIHFTLPEVATHARDSYQYCRQRQPEKRTSLSKVFNYIKEYFHFEFTLVSE